MEYFYSLGARLSQVLLFQLEFIEEKDDMLKQTNEGLKREADALTEKSRGLETALSKLQKEAAFYKQVNFGTFIVCSQNHECLIAEGDLRYEESIQ